MIDTINKEKVGLAKRAVATQVSARTDGEMVGHVARNTRRI
jgi:hypothetical protein